MARILDPGHNYTLRPMHWPRFYELFQTSIKNNWTVDELNFSGDIADLKLGRFTPAEAHMVKRIVAFFATGDNIVNDNVVLSLAKHVNAPEYQMFLARQSYEEMVHVDAYLKLLDVYLDTEAERKEAFSALETIPSIRKKADFCFRWMETAMKKDVLETDADRQEFLLNVMTFGAAVEGLFFMAAFAYIFFLREKGLAQGFAMLNDWVSRDETQHMTGCFELVRTLRAEYPELWNQSLLDQVYRMMDEAVDLECEFAADVLSQTVTGLPLSRMKQFIRYLADRRLEQLGLEPAYGDDNPLDFMTLQGLQPLTNFFEKRVTEYSVAVTGEVPSDFDEDF